MNTSRLFEELRIRDKTLPNRIVMPPMVSRRGVTTTAGIDWYGRHARGGVGLIIVEGTAVNRFGTELTTDSLKPLVDAIHNGGALAAIQLFPVTLGRSVTPAQLDRNEIEAIITAYRRAAEVCLAAGFDGIEPHGAHGYLLNQFFTSFKNKRKDEYGGTLENRMRMALGIVKAMRPVCDEGMLLLYRHSPIGRVYGMRKSLKFAQALIEAGVDILDISPASVIKPGDLAAPFKKRFDIPVIAVKKLDRVERALEVIRKGRADLVAIGRGLIADPEWPIKVRQARFDDIVQCTRCGIKCFGNMWKGMPIECTQWN